MPKDKTPSRNDAKRAASRPAAGKAAGHPQRPADSELRFQHLIRNMVVARDDAHRDRGQS